MVRRFARPIGIGCAIALALGLSTGQIGQAQSGPASFPTLREAPPDEVSEATLITATQPPRPRIPATEPLRSHRVPLRGPLPDEDVAEVKARARRTPGLQPWEMGQADNLEEFRAPGRPAPFGHTVTTSFAGLDRPSAASGGYVFFPPDTVVAKGSAKVLEAVNSALRLSTSDGTAVSTMDFNTFFSYPVNGDPDRILFDPKVFYDRNAANPRFYVIADNAEFGLFHQSRIYLAVSRSTDPADLSAANWCRYFINTRRNKKKKKLESWADYPGLGVGPDALVITANQFTFTTFDYTYAIVRALNKTTLSNNAGGCPGLPKVYTWQPSNTRGDETVFTLQPVQSYTSPSSFSGTTNPAYLIATEYGSSSIYRVWRIRNIATGSPTLGGPADVSGAYTYGIAPDADQAGSAVLLSTGDNRMTSAAGIGDTLYGVHGTVCNFTGGTAEESCVRYVRITVSQDGSGGVAAVLSQQITFGGGDGVFYFWPGVAVNLNEKIIAVFQRSAVGAYLSAWRTGKALADLSFEEAASMTDGTCSQTITNRTGDYVGAQTDPAGTTFWVAGERATLIGGACVWQTWIQQLTAP